MNNESLRDFDIYYRPILVICEYFSISDIKTLKPLFVNTEIHISTGN